MTPKFVRLFPGETCLIAYNPHKMEKDYRKEPRKTPDLKVRRLARSLENNISERGKTKVKKMESLDRGAPDQIRWTVNEPEQEGIKEAVIWYRT